MKEKQVVEEACYMKGKPGKHKHGQSNQKNSAADSSARQHHGKKTYVKKNQCRICFKEGHWANDCPQKTKRVGETNFVEARHLIYEAYIVQECSFSVQACHRFVIDSGFTSVMVKDKTMLTKTAGVKGKVLLGSNTETPVDAIGSLQLPLGLGQSVEVPDALEICARLEI
ncbi:hypothetical protein R1flu_004126 [Riccia fluitans]|uniref:CCHC-type domain-containing protein n=1 Tax=Riccia fluitans TaxID=41844 RepID=A0ABD1YTC8_9MARC